jgi:hypothetical protein
MLSAVYPEYNWLPWKFDRLPRNFWNEIANHRKFLDWAANELEIKEFSDWYKIIAQVIFSIKKL